jgi:hypothetical protein
MEEKTAPFGSHEERVGMALMERDEEMGRKAAQVLAMKAVRMYQSP